MWARFISVVIGAFFMAAPGVFGYGGAAALNDHVVGPIVAGFSFAAAWPVARSLRWVVLVAGAWMFAAPVFIEYTIGGNELQDIIRVWAGLALVMLSVLGRKTRRRFGGGLASVLLFPKRRAREEL